MRVIAIDPGYDRVGIAIMEKNTSQEKVIFSECFNTKRENSFYNRIYSIGTHIHDLITEYKPTAMAIETLYFSKNTSTALKVSEARGVIIFQASHAEIPIYEYTPNQIKVATTGYGKATKKNIYTMVEMLLKLPSRKRLDDEMDALATGITFFASVKNTF